MEHINTERLALRKFMIEDMEGKEKMPPKPLIKAICFDKAMSYWQRN